MWIARLLSAASKNQEPDRLFVTAMDLAIEPWESNQIKQ
ncbi:MAG: hypothetical protein OJF50_004419 [Nitrospira sp.]|nr:hypothetical protein [Nitrospira sp.]